VGLDATASLIVATLGLKEVQSVIGAIRAADAESYKNSLPFSIAPTPPPREVIHLDPRYEPRRVIHLYPLYAPRQIIHLSPRIEDENPCCTCQSGANPVVVHDVPEELPLQPPWKTLPWENPAPPAPKVKLTLYHPDIIHKGFLLDYFC
jgi:hypothetical protein